MPFIAVSPGTRRHMLVWRTRYYDEHPWRVSAAHNGLPVGFGRKCSTWREAMDVALAEVASWS